MYIHKEGTLSILLAVALVGSIFAALYSAINHWNIFFYIIAILLSLFPIVVASFFRIPKRKLMYDSGKIMCPADGKIVAIEEVFDTEFLNEKCVQVSIFMSPANVHVNRYCISGEILYKKHHKGKYFVASHPKSSAENERTTVCIKAPTGERIIERQVAGAMARRIVCYAKEGKNVKQNEELGFIKFGSRVDLLIPLSAKVCVSLGNKVKYGISVIAELA